MTPRPINDEALDGRLIVGLRRVGDYKPHWDGHTMFWSTFPYGIRQERWVYTGILRGVVPEGCEPTHYLPIDGAPDAD